MRALIRVRWWFPEAVLQPCLALITCPRNDVGLGIFWPVDDGNSESSVAGVKPVFSLVDDGKSGRSIRAFHRDERVHPLFPTRHVVIRHGNVEPFGGGITTFRNGIHGIDRIWDLVFYKGFSLVIIEPNEHANAINARDDAVIDHGRRI